MNQNKISLAKKTLQYLEKKKLRDINPSGIRGVIKIKIIFALYYITLFTWFNDENESLEKTMSVLDKYLNNIEKFVKFS